MLKKLFGKSKPQTDTSPALPSSIQVQVTTLAGVEALLTDLRTVRESLPGGPRHEAVRRQIEALQRQESWLRWQAARVDADERCSADQGRLSGRVDEARKSVVDAQALMNTCRERLEREATTLAELQALKAAVDAEAQQREQGWQAQRDEAAAAGDIERIAAVLNARPEGGFQALVGAPYAVAIGAAQGRVQAAENNLTNAAERRAQAVAEITAIEFGLLGLQYDQQCRQVLQQWLRLKKSPRPDGNWAKVPKHPDVVPMDAERVPELRFLADPLKTPLEAPDLGALAVDLATVPLYSDDPIEEERRVTEEAQARAHREEVLSMRDELRKRFGVNWREHVDQGHPALDPAVVGQA